MDDTRDGYACGYRLGTSDRDAGNTKRNYLDLKHGPTMTHEVVMALIVGYQDGYEGKPDRNGINIQEQKEGEDQ